MHTLDQLKPGQKASIVEIRGDEAITARLMEMGLCEGEPIEVIGRAPFRDPVTVLVRGSRLALRIVDARRISVRRSACAVGSNSLSIKASSTNASIGFRIRDACSAESNSGTGGRSIG